MAKSKGKSRSIPPKKRNQALQTVERHPIPKKVVKPASTSKKVTNPTAPLREAPESHQRTPRINRETAHPEMFEVREGTPDLRKAHLDPVLHEKICKSIEKLVPGKNHIVIDRRYRNAVKGIAQREYPKFAVRTGMNKEKNLVYIWRTK